MTKMYRPLVRIRVDVDDAELTAQAEERNVFLPACYNVAELAESLERFVWDAIELKDRRDAGGNGIDEIAFDIVRKQIRAYPDYEEG